jgi:hypothetical protein
MQVPSRQISWRCWTKRETVMITKRGKPVAKLVPVNAETDEIYNFMAGKGVVIGDVVSPAISAADWDGLE